MAVMTANSYIQAVSDFIFVEDQPIQSDAIFVPGSLHDEHVKHAAELYHLGYAPRIIPSGKYAIGSGGFAGDPRYSSECMWMHAVLHELGVPDNAILDEDQATYTWENAQFSRQICDQQGLTIRRAILCCRSYHARRALFYYQAAFPDTEWFVCPASVPGMNRNDWFRTVEGRQMILGEVRRLGSQINEVFDQTLEGKL